MKVLIVGGAGFVGANLARYFAKKFHDVYCFDNLVRRGSEENVKDFDNYDNITFLHGDIRNSEDFDRISFKPDIVFECSAQPTAVDGYLNPRYDFTNNTSGLLNVLEYCRKNDAAVIFWSTNKVYSSDVCNSRDTLVHTDRLIWAHKQSTSLNGFDACHGFSEALTIDGGNHTPYGVTKLSGDLMCQEWATAFGVRSIVNRFSCIYGPNQFGMATQGWVVWFMIAKLLDKPLEFCGFGGRQMRDCLYIDDL